MAQAYVAFWKTIEAKWLAGQRSDNLAAERLYEKVLFRLVDRPGEALAHLAEGRKAPTIRRCALGMQQSCMHW